MKEDINWLRNQGGIMNLVLRELGKRTSTELSEIKKGKRKPRADKGKKRGKRKEKGKQYIKE